MKRAAAILWPVVIVAASIGLQVLFMRWGWVFTPSFMEWVK